MSIEATYAAHPLSLRSITGRILGSRGTLDDLTELDLACDDRSELSDQNHVGGLQYSRELLRDLALPPQSLVLDVGSGLGGFARVAATEYQMRPVAVEFTKCRHDDACALTQLVGLCASVRHVHGDFLALSFEPEQFDAIVLQGSLNHFSEKQRVIELVAHLLRQAGQLAIEEAFLIATPDHKLRKHFDELQSIWNASFVQLEDFRSAVGSYFSNISLARFDCDAALYCERLAHLPEAFMPREERKGLELGSQLIREGLLCYARVICEARR